jgi:hypothetical protein
VVAGFYDAAVVREKRFREVSDAQQLVALAKFPDSGDVMVARGNLPPAVASAFQRRVLNAKNSATDPSPLYLLAQSKPALNSDFDLIRSKLPAEAAFEK